jgi:hypothetical protein
VRSSSRERSASPAATYPVSLYYLVIATGKAAMERSSPISPPSLCSGAKLTPREEEAWQVLYWPQVDKKKIARKFSALLTMSWWWLKVEQELDLEVLAAEQTGGHGGCSRVTVCFRVSPFMELSPDTQICMTTHGDHNRTAAERDAGRSSYA